MNKKILWIVLTLSLAVNISGLATIGYHYWRNFCPTPAAPCPLSPEDSHLYQTLGLSPDQLAKMTALAGAFHRRLNELEGAVAVKRNLLIDTLGEEKADLPKTEILRKEIAGYQDEVQKEVIAHIAESKKIMTPDQQKQFIELLRASLKQGPANTPFPINGGNH